MAKSIPDAYAELRTQLSAIEGVRNAPDYPLESSPTWPYVEMGPVEVEYSGLTMRQPMGEVKLPFKIHVLRSQGLPKAVEQLLPFAERAANLLMYDDNKRNLNGTVNQVAGLTCKMKADKVGETDTLAWDCVFMVKISSGQTAV